MLKNIPALLSPELLKILCEMGHGDTIVLADGNFPAASKGKRLVRLDGHSGTDVLKAIMKVFPLDSFSEDNVILMKTVDPQAETPVIWGAYESILKEDSSFKALSFKERFVFYEAAESAYAVVTTGETALYANVILRKGVL